MIAQKPLPFVMAFVFKKESVHLNRKKIK